MRPLMPLAVLLLLIGCRAASSGESPTPPEDPDEAKTQVRRAIAAHGADRLANAQVRFTFRGIPYRMTRSAGRFTYERWREIRGVAVHEVLTNDGFSVTADGVASPLAPAIAGVRQRSLNSVVYFASLPYGLEDPAVRAKALGRATIRGQPHDHLEVRFDAEGGGEDHRDVFHYWLDAKTGQLAFLAYRFDTGEGGVRFRVAKDTLRAGGVTFVQWGNHGRDGKDLPDLESLPALWEAGGLPLLSSIVIEDVTVSDPE